MVVELVVHEPADDGGLADRLVADEDLRTSGVAVSSSLLSVRAAASGCERTSLYFCKLLVVMAATARCTDAPTGGY